MIILYKEQIPNNSICSISGLVLDLSSNLLIYSVSPCNHTFYYKFLIQSILIQNKNIYSYNRCPQCFQIIEEIPILIHKNVFT